MKKVIAVLLIAMFLFLCGCGEKDENERFVTEYEQGNNGKLITGYIIVVRDTETGVAYLFYKNGYGGGLTQLVEVGE